MKKLFLLLIIFWVSLIPAYAVTITFGNVAGNWSDGTKWVGGVKPAAGNDVVFNGTSAACTLNEDSANIASLNFTGYTSIFTHNTFILNVSGNVTMVAGMTYTPTTSSGCRWQQVGSGTFISGGKNINRITVTSGTMTLGDNLTFSTYNGGVAQVTLNSGCTLNLGGFTLSGNSVTNRAYIISSVIGSPRTLTVNGGTFANADFRDITFSNATDLDLSGITGGSGDCGGNSITGGGTVLTFTSPTTQTWNGTTGNWSDNTKWTSRVPLPQDTAILAGTNVCTVNMPRLCKDISFSAACPLTLGSSVISYGSVNLTGMGTFSGAFVWTFESQARSGNIYLTSGGKSFPTSIIIQPVNATLQLLAALSSGGSIVMIAGTFDASVYNVTVNDVQGSSVSATRTMNLGTGVWSITTSSLNAGWDMSAGTVPTINAGTSTIQFTDTGANAKRFYGGGKTYYNLNIPTGSGGVIFYTTGNNLFNKITVSAGGKLTLVSTSTQTVNQFVAIGSSGNLITLQSDTPGSAATLTKSGGGTIQTEWCSITDINVTPANTWYYGNHATYVSGTGWVTGEQPNFLEVF